MSSYFSHKKPRTDRRPITARRLLALVALAGTLNLQGCATSTETFALGALLGSVAGVTAVTCTVLCH